MTRYQLVIQFSEDFFATHQDLVAFEERLIASLPRTCTVDGHDVGAGTVNFFVHTSAPEAAHRAFRKHLGTNAIESKVRIAYRELDGTTFTKLWPRRDPRPFAYTYEEGANPFARGAKRDIPKRTPRATSTVTKTKEPRSPAPRKRARS